MKVNQIKNNYYNSANHYSKTCSFKSVKIDRKIAWVPLLLDSAPGEIETLTSSLKQLQNTKFNLREIVNLKEKTPEYESVLESVLNSMDQSDVEDFPINMEYYKSNYSYPYDPWGYGIRFFTKHNDSKTNLYDNLWRYNYMLPENISDYIVNSVNEKRSKTDYVERKAPDGKVSYIYPLPNAELLKERLNDYFNNPVDSIVVKNRKQADAIKQEQEREQAALHEFLSKEEMALSYQCDFVDAVKGLINKIY